MQISRYIEIMPQCVAVKCKNRGAHRFPKDEKRRKLWEKALKRKNWKSTATSRLCSDHFLPTDYIGCSSHTGNKPLSKFLKKDAIPTVFDTETEHTKQRRLRYAERCRRKLNMELLQPTTSSESPKPEFMEIESEVQVESESVSVPPTDERGFASISTQVYIEFMYGSIVRYKDDPDAILFYTGFESYHKFYLVYSTLSPLAYKMQYYESRVINLSAENQFFLTVMKLRQNKANFELARFFNVSLATVSNIFITWINYIYQLWSTLNIWPDKDLVLYCMPESFKRHHRDTRVILDGTEIPIQKPQNPLSQQASWSSYKHGNTLKVLVGATPGGLLSYCSPAYAGSISDRQTVERSDLLSKCQPGDSIMADRGFNIQDICAPRDVSVNIPTFLKGTSQLSGIKLLHDRKLAQNRVHIERLIGLTKTYKILTTDLDHNYVPIASKIFFVCFMCCNFRECIIKSKQ